MANMTGMDSEQKGVHPVLIMSTKSLNNTSSNAIVFPITHQNKKKMPFHYVLTKEKYNFFTYENNIVQPECMKHMSVNRLQRKMGSISQQDIEIILQYKEFVFIEKNKKIY